MSKAYYIGSEIESEVRGIVEASPELKIGPTRPPNMPDEEGECILGMYLMEEDSCPSHKWWNLDDCPLVDFPMQESDTK